MKISIITINYNDAKGLERTISSVISSKTDNIEYLVVDGGSKDESVSIIDKYKEHIDFWVSEPDNGIYNAMNKGIKAASGDYIMFINSGDLITDHKKFKELLTVKYSEDIIYFNLEIANTTDNNRFIKTYPAIPDFKYFAEDSLSHTGTLIKKERLSEYGYYNEHLKIVADWAFYLDSILKNKCTYRYVDGCFARFYLGGLSSNPANLKKLWEEKSEHIKNNYPLFFTMYQDWMQKKAELYKLKSSITVRTARKIGLLKWLNDFSNFTQ